MRRYRMFWKLILTVSLLSGFAAAEKPKPESVKAITQRVADWQMETFEDQVRHRGVPFSLQKVIKEGSDNKGWVAYAKSFSKKWHDSAWHNAALYAGMNEWRKVADDSEPYTQWLRSIGERNNWKPHWRKYSADDHAVGHYYLALYEEFQDQKMIEPLRERFNWIMENPKTGSLEWKTKGTDCHVRWGWCDALFMAPPVWARLAKVTGERKYLDFMDSEYHATYDFLWDKEEQLFYRDSSYFKKHEKNGKKLFWSRGNGWVFSGLALMIPDLPTDWEGRQFYVDLLEQMAETLKTTQRADGTWSMGLLGDPKDYPIPETSGTAFFTHGLAWGINNGILDRATYEPVVLKAWKALVDCVTEEGLLGHVQPVGASPGESYPDKSEVFGVGAFLSAGSEVYRLVGGEVLTCRKKAAPEIVTFMKNSGWCWYQDPRAIIHEGKIIIGGVEGNGAGAAVIGVYDLEKKKILGRTVVHESFDKDDHNSPVFWARSDGSLLTVYARHGKDKSHRYRFSTSDDFLQWDAEKEFKHPHATTYMNLYEMKSEGTLYNFYRGFDWNPSFITSKDGGKTWGEDTHFFKNEVGGRHRPYARYAGNGTDAVYVSITDAHPRNFGNSIYYFEFRNGKFFKADGTLIKALADGPLLPSESELVYKGTGNPGRRVDQSAIGAAWTSSIAIDAKGYPHIGYTLYLSNDNHRYRVASWDGSKWIDREVAFGGKCLYDRESSYTGLITLDPSDPGSVYISTDVDPATGKDLGGTHEIYSSKIGINDDIKTIKWKAVTSGSSQRNIRPAVVAGDGYKALLWQSGTFNTYTDYDLDVNGLILERP